MDGIGIHLTMWENGQLQEKDLEVSEPVRREQDYQVTNRALTQHHDLRNQCNTMVQQTWSDCNPRDHTCIAHACRLQELSCCWRQPLQVPARHILRSAATSPSRISCVQNRPLRISLMDCSSRDESRLQTQFGLGTACPAKDSAMWTGLSASF